MPFFDDSGVRLEEHKGPLLSSLAILCDQVERMVALNIAWAAQQIPWLMAFAFQGWPMWARVPLALYSALAFTPTTALLFGMLARACDGELLSVRMARESLRRLALPSVVTLVPLYSAFIGLPLLAWWAGRQGWLLVDVVARLAILLLAVCAIYWGPLFAQQPKRSAVYVLRQSVELVWRFPLQTILTGIAVLLGLLLGLISIGGLVLVVPLWVALLEIQQYRDVMRPSELGVLRDDA
jgi:hypothetical protein